MPVNRRKFLTGTGVSAIGAAVAARAGRVEAQTKSAAKDTQKATPAKETAAPARTRQTTAAKPKGKTSRRRILTEKAPRPGGPYSQAIVSGNTVYVAGQAPINPKTGNIDVTTFEEQAVQVFENIKAILEA